MAQLSQAAGKKALYISSNAYANIALWAASHSYNVGDVVRPSATSLGITMTQANPGVFTWLDNGGTALTHNFQTNDILQFINNSDTLPGAGTLAFATNYFVQSPSGSTFDLAATWGGSNINTTAGTPAGTHKAVCINERYALCYVCIVAGTSASSLEPVWPSHLDTSSTRGNTVVDGGTLKWMEATGCAILNGDVTGTPTWAEGGAAGYQTYGQVITNNAKTYVFICTTNNVAAAGSEPSWNTTTGVATTDGSASWTCLGSVSTWQAKKWASPFKRMMDSTQVGWGDGMSGGTLHFYVGNSHHGIYSSQSYNNWQQRGASATSAYYICVNEAGSCPPTSSDVTTGAHEEELGGGYYYPATPSWAKIYGIKFNLSYATFGYGLSITGPVVTEQCQFFSTNAGINPTDRVEWKNCSVKFGAVGGNIYTNGDFYWHNDDPTVPGLLSGNTPTTYTVGGGGGVLTIEGVDLATNNVGSMMQNLNGISTISDLTLRNCKIPTGTMGQHFDYGHTQRMRIINCDNGAFFNHSETWDYAGHMVTDRVAYASGGATIQGSAYSWAFTSQYATDAMPWYSLPISAYNTNITGTVTATLYGCTTGALPTNNECWLEADFLGATSSPLASGISGRCALLVTPTNLTTDTTDWSLGGAARVNSHAYSVGAEITVASSGGNRLFVCTASSGNSAASLPGAYATAVDGSAVTDGSCTFTAVVRFKLVLSLTTYPLVTGPINAIIRVQNASITKSYWFDPVLNLS